MNAYNFGRAVGTYEKRAFITETVGGLHGAYTAPAGSKFEGAARGMIKAPAQVAGGVLGAGAGALHGIAGSGYRGVLNVAKGMDIGANTGTRAMDAVLGGPAKGIGGKILRAPAQAIGAGVGALGGTLTAPIAALGGMASDIYGGARRGANLGGAAVTSLAGGAPSWQQPAKAANALTVAKPLVGELVRQAPIVAKAVPRQAAQSGSNAMKYLGAGAAGLAAGVAGSKLLGDKGQQSQSPAQEFGAKAAYLAQPNGPHFNPVAASVAPTKQPSMPKFSLPPQMQQQQRQKFEQGVGKMFGQTAQKVVGGLNTASDMLRSTVPTTMPSGRI